MLHLLVLVVTVFADDERGHCLNLVVEHIIPIDGIVITFATVVMFGIVVFVVLHLLHCLKFVVASWVCASDGGLSHVDLESSISVGTRQAGVLDESR